MSKRIGLLAVFVLLALSAGCSGEEGAGHGRGGGPGGGGPRGGGGAGAPGMAAAVPVEVAPVSRSKISSYIETNGVLEAENEVDILARNAGPIVELNVEEGMPVRSGQLLARIDESEYRAQLEISRVTLNETLVAFERAKRLQQDSLISPETYEQAVSAYESARAQFQASELFLDYTSIKAPFNGLIVNRYVDFAQQVSNNTPLFRISDFDPLLCPIQIPERELSLLRLKQPAYLTLESFPEERFEASVLRISPVVDAATGTIKVTLEVKARGKLRPGMFARVFVETASRPDALVIPRAALSLESIGDTVYVASDDRASRREVELGFREGDVVEVLSGLTQDERVVVVGQDGLSDGTPIRVLDSAVAAAGAGEPGPPASGGPGDFEKPSAEAPPAERSDPVNPAERPSRGGRDFDPSKMTPEQLERVKERMRARGMSEEQIEERLKRTPSHAETE